MYNSSGPSSPAPWDLGPRQHLFGDNSALNMFNQANRLHLFFPSSIFSKIMNTVFDILNSAATRPDCIYSTRLRRVAGHVEDGQGGGGRKGGMEGVGGGRGG